TIKCAANLRSIGQGLAAYEAENNQYLPAAYNYRGSSVTTDTTGTVTQTPTGAKYGYMHWSAFLLGQVSPDAFKCPAINNGGLPATDPDPANGGFDAGQTTDANDTGGTAGQADPYDGRVVAINA